MEKEKTIRIWVDGGSSGNPGRSAIAVFYELDEETRYLSAFRIFDTTNNVAEYFAIYLFLKNFLYTSPEFSYIYGSKLIFYSDSQLVVNQLNGLWEIKDKTLKTLAYKILENLKELKEKNIISSWEIKWIPKEENKICDNLVKLVLYKKL
jgi:ribonuclease HI